MSRPAEELLEFDKLKEIVGGFTTYAGGNRAAAALHSGQDIPSLDAEFALIRDAMAYLRAGFELGFRSVADPEPWLVRLPVPALVFSSRELLDVATLIEAAAFVRQTLRSEAPKYPQLAERAAALADLRDLAVAIHRAILPDGEISDDASPQLRRIRDGIAQGRTNIQQSLRKILRARGEMKGESGGEDYVTLRNERFVIPVRASDRRDVPGVVHGASATGQTMFVEPLEAIELNNRLVQLSDEEMAEISRILAKLSDRVRAASASLDSIAASIAHFDSIFARARFARDYDCVIPDLVAGRALYLKEARNPVLEAALRPQGRKAVPLTLSLGDPETVLVISGPNTGGKTVALKTVGIATLSAQSCIPVAAETAQMPIFDFVLADIGDEQSIAADLSTFSAHMLNLKHMLAIATERSLILVDEMGTGTAPEEGAAIAVAFLEEFREKRSLTLATTHHDRLKSYASTTPGIQNAATEFDEENLRPTFRLLTGVPGTSSGLQIARRLGLPARLVDRALATLSPESREARDLIAYLHRSRDEMDALRSEAREELAALAAERASLRTEWVDRQKKRIADLEKAFLDLQKNFQAEVARLTEDIKDRALRLQIEKQSRKRMDKIASQSREDADAAVLETLAASQEDLGMSPPAAETPVAVERLSAGQRIRVKGFKQPVIFRWQDGRTAEVEAGPLRMKVALADIVGIEEAPQPAKRNTPAGRRGITLNAQAAGHYAAEEINVIGCTVEEASERVDKFLDEAAVAGKPSVRIIHGHGTGALRRGLAQFLSGHPLVDVIHAEAQERGGTAVTVAELKS